MDDSTIHTLNEINRRFYATVAREFDSSRQQPWPGWDRVLDAIRAPDAAHRSILDVGCGNGRFGVFLADRLGKDGLRYVGIDSSPALLERAQAALSGIDARLEQRDIVELPPDETLGQFDLVVLFGVLHHVPGANQRLALMRALADRVAAGGLLVFTEWRFVDLPRLRQRIVPWPAMIDVEPGDYLLDWRRGRQTETAPALRYCHDVDEAEHMRLIAASRLALLTEYRADAANRYTILRQPLPPL